MFVPRRAFLMAFCLSTSALCPVRGDAADRKSPVAPNFDPPDLPVLHSFRESGILKLGFSTDGRVLYTFLDDDGNGNTPFGPRLRDVGSGKLRDRFDSSLGVRQLGVLGAIYFNVAFSPDGRTLAADFAGNTPPEVGYLLLLDAGSGKLLKKLSCYGSTAWLAFSPDGTTLAVGQGKAQGMVKCYYVSTGKTAWETPSHTGPGSFNTTNWEAFAPDGKTVAAEFADGSVSLFDAASGQEAVLQPAPPYNGRNHRLAYSSDGQSLATLGLWDEEVRVWNVASRKVAHLIPLKPTPIPYSFHLPRDSGSLRARDRIGAPGIQGNEMGFSPDGRTLLVWCSDDRIRLFEAASGQLRQEVAFRGVAVAFSPATTVAATVSSGGAVYLCDWRADGGSPPLRLRPGEAERLWDDLASDDGAAAWRAVLSFAAAPRQAAKTLGAHLRPREPVPARELEQMTAQLNADVFEEREEATRRLAALGEAAGPTLRQALANQPPPELRRRAEELVARLERPPGPEEFRKIRAVEALEYAGSAEARGLLKEWAAGAAGVRLTEEARAALRRLEHKPPPSDP